MAETGRGRDMLRGAHLPDVLEENYRTTGTWNMANVVATKFLDSSGNALSMTDAVTLGEAADIGTVTIGTLTFKFPKKGGAQSSLTEAAAVGTVNIGTTDFSFTDGAKVIGAYTLTMGKSSGASEAADIGTIDIGTLNFKFPKVGGAQSSLTEAAGVGTVNIGTTDFRFTDGARVTGAYTITLGAAISITELGGTGTLAIGTASFYLT